MLPFQDTIASNHSFSISQQMIDTDSISNQFIVRLGNLSKQFSPQQILKGSDSLQNEGCRYKKDGVALWMLSQLPWWCKRV